MPNEVAHSGCWNCKSEEEPVLMSKTIYNVYQFNKRESRLENMAPYSIALCSKPACQEVTKINLTTREAMPV